MFRKIQEARENEEGFTLIELLVVVIIIGILAAIAIPVFLNQRENAYRAAVESDLHNAGIAFESYFVENSAYPGTLPGTVETSENVSLTVGTSTASGSFCIEADHSQLNGSGTTDGVYDSDDGGVLMGGSCT